jgi:hypothetical protein
MLLMKNGRRFFPAFDNNQSHGTSMKIMTSARDGGMKNSEPLKVDETRPRAD